MEQKASRPFARHAPENGPPEVDSAATVLSQQDSSATGQQPWPSTGRAWCALFVLMVVLLLAILDRQIITLLVEPIKSDLGISDTQMSLLMGFAFVTFYMLIGLPISRLSDVGNRRLTIGVGLALWSAMTTACGLARNYWQLFAARVGVGVGEACNGPATFSLLADYFPPQKLPVALSVLSIGFYAGTALANIVGSRVVALTSALQASTMPLIGAMHPWQVSFFLVGLPGLAAVALLFTVQEPKRRGVFARGAEAKQRVNPRGMPFQEVVIFLADNWKTYAPLYAGLAFRLMVTVGSAVWLPTFFHRTYGWTSVQSGFAIGAVQLPISILGLVSGGFLAQWLAERGYADANVRVNLISTLLVLPTSILFPLMPVPWLALTVFGANCYFTTLGTGPIAAALQVITPNQLRAQLSAVFLVEFNLVGMGLGPLIVAFLTDHVFGADSALRYSLTCAAAMLLPLACLSFWFGLRPYRAGVIRAKAWS
jgi:MFS family permease